MLKHDPLIGVFQPVQFVEEMVDAWWREEGTGILSAGQEEKVRDSDAGLQDDGNRPRQKPKTESLEAASKLENPAESIRALCAATDKAGVFAWKHLSSVLCYAAERLTEIADDVVTVDNAMKWGYNWERAPLRCGTPSGWEQQWTG